MKTLLGALLVGALLIPASARAAWTAPAPVPGSAGQATSAPHVLVTRTRGGAIAVNASGSDAEHRQVTRAPLGPAPGPATTWPGGFGFDLTFGQLAAADRIIYEGAHNRRVQIGLAAGPRSDFKTYLRGPKTGGARVAVAAAKGGTAAAFGTFETGSIGRVYLVLQNGTAAPGSTLTLSGRGHIRSVAVARNARGDVLVAWDRSGRIESRLYAKHRLGPVKQLGTDRVALALTVALGADGRAIVAWVDQAVNEGGASAGRLMAVARGATTGFGAPLQLDTYPVNTIPGGIAVKATFAGARGILAFSGSNGIKVSLVTVRAFSAPQTIGAQAPDPSWVRVGLGDLAVSPQGQAVVTWTARVDPTNTQIMASTFDGQAFGPATNVSAPGPQVQEPSVAFAGEHAILAWVDQTQAWWATR
jgi:hypothetical protein